MASNFTWKLLPVGAFYLWAVFSLAPALLHHFTVLGAGSLLLRFWLSERAAKNAPSRSAHPALEISADLTALCFLAYGIVQFQLEMDRGTLLGAAVGLTIVTPVGCLATRLMFRFLLRSLIP
jgi:hypothetical protein